MAISVFLIIVTALYLVLRQRRKSRVLPGPPRPSWLFGNEREFKGAKEAGVTEEQWVKDYGNIFSFGGCFGSELLFVADPKALQYILHTSGYRFHKAPEVEYFFTSFLGEGMASVAGEIHKRQRHILTPAFSGSQLKSFLTLFQTEGAKLCELLKVEIGGGGGGVKVVNVSEWTHRIALDLIGLSSFRHYFGSLDGQEDKLTHEMKNIAGVAMNDPHPLAILCMALWRVLPSWMLSPLDLILCKLTPWGLLQTFQTESKRISRDIVNKALEDQDSIGEKDIIGLLASSILVADENKKMTDNEIMSQMSTFIVGGQDTSSITLSLLLYELAKNPKDQIRLRAEIFDLLSKKEGKPLMPADYESLSFLNACIKETLRLHPIVTVLIRCPHQDDAIPVSEPVKLANGAYVTQVPVRKGQSVYCSVYMYNRLKKVWGEDAEVWNPERFLIERKDFEGANVGVFANLLTFSGGNRSCIGWRFALMEIQTLSVLLLQHFEFEGAGSIKHANTPGIGMFPFVEGREEEGMQVPLKMKVIE